MLKNETWERLAEQLGKGLPQDPRYWVHQCFFEPFWYRLVDFGSTWRQMAAQGCQNGAQNGLKIDAKIYAKIDAEKVTNWPNGRSAKVYP